MKNNLKTDQTTKVFNDYYGWKGQKSFKPTLVLADPKIMAEIRKDTLALRIAKQQKNEALKVELKGNSVAHQLAVDYVERAAETLKTKQFLFQYVVIDVDKIDEMPQGTEQLIINYFKQLNSCSYIERSGSGNGYHIYLQINKYLTHYEFRRYFLGLMVDLYVDSAINYCFVDTAMSRSTQFAFITNDPIYINNDSVDYTGHVRVYPNELVYNYLYKMKGNLPLDVENYIKDEANILIEQANNNTFKKKDVEQLYDFVDRKGNVLSEEMQDGEKIELSKAVQMNAISTLTYKTLNKEIIIKGGTNHTYHKEIVSVITACFHKINIDRNNVLEHLNSLSENKKYLKTVEAAFIYYSRNFRKQGKLQNFLPVQKKKLNLDYVNKTVLKVEKYVNDNDTIILNKGEKIHLNMLGDLDNNKTYIVADTKTGKTYSTINYFDKSKDTILFLVPTNKLKTEVIESYNGVEFTSSSKQLKVGLYVGTYDSFVHYKTKNNGYSEIQNVKLIIDEVHTIITEDYRSIMNELFEFINDGGFKTTILMTATPTNEFNDYKKITIKYNEVTKGNLTLFMSSFVNYVIHNLDVDKNNLIYYNDIDKLQKIYNNFKSKGLICKLLISDSNISFNKMNSVDMKNPDYKVINTYLTTKVVEVGIGLPEFINAFYINPYQQTSIMGIQSFEQLLNRDNRMDTMTGERVVNVYVRTSDAKLTATEMMADKLSDRIITPEYKKAMTNYYDDISLNLIVIRFIETIYNSRYISEFTSDINFYDDVAFIDRKDFNESDWDKIKKDDVKMENILRVFDKFGYRFNREFVNNYIMGIDYITFKENFFLAKIEHKYKRENLIFDIQQKITSNDLNGKIKQHLNNLVKLEPNLIVESDYKCRTNILRLYNHNFKNDTITFTGVKDFGINYQDKDKTVDLNKCYTNKELKTLCLENGLNYKETVMKFKPSTKLVNKKRIRVLKPF